MKTLLTIYIVFAWSALFAQVNNPYDLSPTNRNHRERKSFQVGDLTGNDSLVGVGAVVYFVKGSGTVLFDSTQFITSNDTIGINASVLTAIGTPLLSITAPLTIVDADTITIANQYISSVSTGNVTFSTSNGGLTKNMSLFDKGANFNLTVDSLEYISGLYYDTTGSNIPQVELSIFNINRQEDVASIQAKYLTTHPHLFIQLLDIAVDTVEETTIHQHGELLFENMAGYRFQTDTTNFIVPKVQGTAGQVLSLTSAVTGATGWITAGGSGLPTVDTTVNYNDTVTVTTSKDIAINGVGNGVTLITLSTASFSQGDIVIISDVNNKAAVNNIVIDAGTGNLISATSSAQTYTISNDGVSVSLRKVLTDTWKIF